MAGHKCRLEAAMKVNMFMKISKAKAPNQKTVNNQRTSKEKGSVAQKFSGAF